MDNSNGNEKALVPTESNSLGPTRKYEPQVLETVSDLIQQANRHQYRHIKSVSLKRLVSLLSAAVAMVVVREWILFVDEEWYELLFHAIGTLMAIGLYAGLASVLARAISGLFSFRQCVVAVAIGFLLYDVYAIVTPTVVKLSSFFFSGDEVVYLIYYGLLVVVLNQIFRLMVVHRWVTVARYVYGFVILMAVATLLLSDNVRHWVRGDREVYYFHSTTAPSAEPISEINRWVESLAKKLPPTQEIKK